MAVVGVGAVPDREPALFVDDHRRIVIDPVAVLAGPGTVATPLQGSPVRARFTDHDASSGEQTCQVKGSKINPPAVFPSPFERPPSLEGTLPRGQGKRCNSNPTQGLQGHLQGLALCDPALNAERQ